jgi:hypothetical protein
LPLGACGGDHPSGPDSGGNDAAATDAPNNVDAKFGDVTPPPDAAPNCAGGTTDVIYLVGLDATLRSFNPKTLAVSPLGAISCPQDGGTATPMSMAVDRNAQAWVLYSDGHIFKVDIASRACTATTYAPNQHNIMTFGMAFALDTQGGDTETLYISDAAGTGLGKIDLTTMTLNFINPYTPNYTAPAELTGRGDGKLFAFFVQIPVTIAGIDKTNANVLTYNIPSPANVGPSWAFSSWGGNFYVFTKTGNATTSHVDLYDPVADKISTIVNDVGIEVVGAGVSTCAPYEPPK